MTALLANTLRGDPLVAAPGEIVIGRHVGRFPASGCDRGRGGAAVCQDQSFDLVVSALSLHWVNDLPGALIQIRRVLKPDGLFIATCWAGARWTELRQSLLAAEEEIRGGAANRVSPYARRDRWRGPAAAHGLSRCLWPTMTRARCVMPIRCGCLRPARHGRDGRLRQSRCNPR
jgi:SAM-dependent methyltransferase